MSSTCVVLFVLCVKVGKKSLSFYTNPFHWKTHWWSRSEESHIHTSDKLDGCFVDFFFFTSFQMSFSRLEVVVHYINTSVTTWTGRAVQFCILRVLAVLQYWGVVSLIYSCHELYRHRSVTLCLFQGKVLFLLLQFYLVWNFGKVFWWWWVSRQTIPFKFLFLLVTSLTTKS